jgi:hypothetical protein
MQLQVYLLHWIQSSFPNYSFCLRFLQRIQFTTFQVYSSSSSAFCFSLLPSDVGFLEIYTSPVEHLSCFPISSEVFRTPQELLTDPFSAPEWCHRAVESWFASHLNIQVMKQHFLKLQICYVIFLVTANSSYSETNLLSMLHSILQNLQRRKNRVDAGRFTFHVKANNDPALTVDWLREKNWTKYAKFAIKCPKLFT